MLILIIHLFSIVNSVISIFNVIPNNTNLATESIGLLDENSFHYVALDLKNSNDTLPLSIKLTASVFGVNISLTLNKIEGFMQTSSLKSNVYFNENSVDKILNYQIYTDEANSMFATVIENTDLDSIGFYTGGYNYRIVATTSINGNQINFQAAIVYNSLTGKQISYQHIYFIVNNIIGNDEDTGPLDVSNPCETSNPCQNNATCALGYDYSLVCFCPSEYSGKYCDALLTTTTLTTLNNDHNNILLTFHGITTTATTKQKTLCDPNPCKNRGACSINSNLNTYTCFCTPQFKGKQCDDKNTNTQPFPGFRIGKGLENFERFSKPIEKERRDLKDAADSIVQNLFVELLIVIDSTVYNDFLNFGNLNKDLIGNYINVFFIQYVNGINLRYHNSMSNDPNMIISVILTNVLVLDDPTTTPWTDLSIVGVPGWYSFNNKTSNKPAILAPKVYNLFANTMNTMNLSYSYDYAVAIMDLDIWSGNENQNASIRRATTGYTYQNGGICGSNRYSISEYIGFSGIQNNAHELGHSLGAGHDGDFPATSCPASNNNIMTPVVGAFTNASNLFFFSSCSINEFKTALLSTDMITLNPAGQCLSNFPISTIVSYYQLAFETTYLPGKMFTIDQQCKLKYGPRFQYCYQAYDNICQILYCGVLCPGGIGTSGYGALDGTPCFTYGNASGMVCYQGSCINESSITYKNNNCEPNSCKNGGICNNGFSTFAPFICTCQDGFTGSDCSYTFSDMAPLLQRSISMITLMPSIRSTTDTTTITTSKTLNRSNTSSIIISTSTVLAKATTLISTIKSGTSEITTSTTLSTTSPKTAITISSTTATSISALTKSTTPSTTSTRTKTTTSSTTITSTSTPTISTYRTQSTRIVTSASTTTTESRSTSTSITTKNTSSAITTSTSTTTTSRRTSTSSTTTTSTSTIAVLTSSTTKNSEIPIISTSGTRTTTSTRITTTISKTTASSWGTSTAKTKKTTPTSFTKTSSSKSTSSTSNTNVNTKSSSTTTQEIITNLFVAYLYVMSPTVNGAILFNDNYYIDPKRCAGLIKNGFINYYCVDGFFGTIRLDCNWNIISTNKIVGNFITTMNSYLIYTGLNGIAKYDSNFNLITSYTRLNTSYTSAVYDQQTQTLLSVDTNPNRVDIFDQNLNLFSTISTDIFIPYSIALFNGNYYISASCSGSVLLQLVGDTYQFILSFRISSGIQACPSPFRTSILFDSCGNIGLTCLDTQYFYIFNSFGVYSNWQLSRTGQASFDFSGRFVVFNYNGIFVYSTPAIIDNSLIESTKFCSTSISISNIFGIPNGKPFSVTVANVSSMVVYVGTFFGYTQKYVIGIKFIYMEGNSVIYGASSTNLNLAVTSYTVNLMGYQISGISITSDTYINSIQIQLYNPITQTYFFTSQFGNPFGTITNLTSTLIKSLQFQIYSFLGYADSTNSTLPSLRALQFGYSYSQCSRSTPSTKTTTSTKLRYFG